ncbi:MAG: LysR family transcriptional regulator [Lachnospiraceae bacterium]|nr:LysR family transcriptional regulator [Lachnospiraceae bacterium]
MSASFDYYRIFYYVGRTGSITAAAGALYLTQPTISHAIRNLEEELGCTLFLRTKKGVIMTPEARQLYSHISIACEQILKGEEKLRAALQLSEGSLTIGATETVLHFYLIPWLKQYRSLYPDIKLKIANSSTPATLQTLKQGILDFAILVMDTDERVDRNRSCENDFHITPLESFHDIFVTGNDYTFLADKPVTLKQLTGYPLICLEKGTCTRSFLDNILATEQMEWIPDIELANSDLIMPMVTQNFGIGFTPEYFAREALAQKKAVALNLKEEIPARSICLVCTDSPRSAAAEAFIRMISPEA